MLVILSPAKTMDMSPISDTIPISTPLFVKDAEYLVSKMQVFSSDDLKKKLKISDSLAQMNYDRYKYFDTSPNKQALFAYNGSVFKHLKVKDFSNSELNYAQGRIRIISTLYGVLRPLDLIKAYRISFNLNLDGINGNLYDYWLPKLTNLLIEDAGKVGNVIVNLASVDVFGAIDSELLEKNVRVITPEFKLFKDGKYETVRTYAKMARGEMTRYIIKNKIENWEDLKGFSWKEFEFNENISSGNNLIFTRNDQ